MVCIKTKSASTSLSLVKYTTQLTTVKWAINIKIITVKPRSIQTPYYYGQFALSSEKESPYIFKVNPRNMDTPLTQTPSMHPLVPVLTAFHCTVKHIAHAAERPVTKKSSLENFRSLNLSLILMVMIFKYEWERSPQSSVEYVGGARETE